MSSSDLLRQPKQRKLLFSAGISWLFDAMDVGLLSFVVTDLAKKWSLTSSQIGVLTSINAIGMVFGAALAGIFADRFGRKTILLWTLLIFSVASGLSALAAGFTVLCILRFIVGVGLGGELPVASTLVSESVPVKDRGRAVVLLESFWAVGWILAAVVSYFVIPKYGWQAAFVIGAVPALYGLYLRRAIEDSPEYLSRRKEPKLTFGERFKRVWAPEVRRSTLMLWILWFTVVFSYYGMFLWLPTVMEAKGYSMVRSFEYVLLMTLAQLPGYFTAAYLIEKLGRKFVLVVYLLLTALSALWFGHAASEVSLLIAGICLSFFNLGAWGAMYAYSPEQYTTRLRATGVGMATAFGRIGGVIGPLLVGLMRDQSVPIATIFTMFFVTVLVGAAAVLFLGKETKGLEIND
ncbi:MFS transporter [Paenibacillus yonginensis]|uniref:MFS transporter n=1 Tax=Paenibacillus yonginensis TaxID=1462996 RepID=A0A1B1N369_9BACL|nr:MFS transporter [Paenibacillus yonginensis]ANS75849.1 MFS transporter [Paenibacillus yonginensis]